MTTTVTPLGTYRNEKPYPFCPGCGHGPILDRLNDALVQLQVDPAKTVIVSDIGCSGLSDQYFATSAFHGLHGRSVTYATGIKLANPELTVIVIMGDGGTGIGGTHLVNAARRNIGVTVIVMNNLNFGMTGGQHSTTTPEGAITSTTPGGNLEHPMDIAATVGVNGAAYVYRGTSFDEDLADRIAEALRHPGFALLDIWELCTAYYVRANRFSRRGIEQTMEELGFERGLRYEREVVEYAAGYRAASRRDVPSRVAPKGIEVAFEHHLERPVTLLIAGSAGGKVRTAARIVAEAAIASGLWVTQKDDYPVTVKTGHSLSTLTLSPDPLPPAPAEAPDAAVVVSEVGFHRARSLLAAMPSDGMVALAEDVAVEGLPCRVDPIERPEGVGVGKAGLALYLTAAAVARLGWFDVDALRSAAASGPFGEANTAIVEAGLGAG